MTEGDGIDQETGFHYVDLGLSVKWATCNVGADKAIDNGLLFQFGGINGCEYEGDDASTIFKKPLLKSDLNNTAEKVMGGNWSTPSIKQLEELFKNDNIIKDPIAINGVPGVLFTSQIENHEGKQLFIPASIGFWDGYNTKFTKVDYDTMIYLWSSENALGPYDNITIHTNGYLMSWTYYTGTPSKSSLRLVNGYNVRGVLKNTTTLEEI